ncbi:MFS transporter [Paraburkholderia strydomiana]
MDISDTTTDMRTEHTSTTAVLAGPAAISARLERLPFTRWHAKVLGAVGFVHMTDAFDALTIAYVLPVLIELWHLSPAKAGLLVSAGYVGQTIGALLFSAAAERFGRLRSLRWVIVVLSLLSLASTYAPGYAIFLVIRFCQGIGLGGESPVSATYMNELCPAKIRGRLIFVLQSTFGVGNLLAAICALSLIPAYGWQVMFFIGTAPIVLAVILPRIAPESPRWLAINNRGSEAETIVGRIERSLPEDVYAKLPPISLSAEPPRSKKESFRSLLSAAFVSRTLVVWAMACCSGLTTYGILVWLPALYRTVYHLPLDVSLRYGMFSMVATLLGALSGIFLIDRIGRKKTFCLAFIGSALPMIYLAFNGTHNSAAHVAVLASTSIAMIAIVQCGIFVYAPEVYPTRVRARGAGAAAAFTRLSSVAGPLVIGALLTYFHVEAVFGYLAAVAVVGAVIFALFGIETRGKTLDEISA